MARRPRLIQRIAEKLQSRAPSIRAAKSRWGWGNPDIAQRIAGTTDKKSREYKNALRRVQRAAKSGKSTPEIRKALGGEAERRAWKRIRRQGVSQLSIKSGRYWVSDPRRVTQNMGDGIRALDPIGGAAFAPVLDELEAARIAEMTGDPEAAAEHLQNANDNMEEIISEAYGMAGGQVAHFEEVGDVDITIR